MENEQESEAIVQAMLGSTGISEEATIVTKFGAEYLRDWAGSQRRKIIFAFNDRWDTSQVIMSRVIS